MRFNMLRKAMYFFFGLSFLAAFNGYADEQEVAASEVASAEVDANEVEAAEPAAADVEVADNASDSAECNDCGAEAEQE